MRTNRTLLFANLGLIAVVLLTLPHRAEGDRQAEVPRVVRARLARRAPVDFRQRGGRRAQIVVETPEDGAAGGVAIACIGGRRDDGRLVDGPGARGLDAGPLSRADAGEQGRAERGAFFGVGERDGGAVDVGLHLSP